MQVFVASDLQRQRKAVLKAAHDQPVLIRDTDGTVLALHDAGELDRLQRVLQIASDFAALVGSVDTPSPTPASLGAFSWAAQWPPERRKVLANDIADALALAVSIRDPEPVEVLLRQAAKPPSGGRFDATEMWKNLDEEDRERLRIGKGLPARVRAAS